jgi:transaldolase
MRRVSDLKVKIFADGADKAGMLEMNEKTFVSGFTTNPTLMKMAGVSDYEAFAKDILLSIPDKPVSLEVFSDDFQEMERQALKLNDLGSNVYVKIPISNTKGETSYDLIKTLSGKGVKLNVTALMTLEQVRETTYAMEKASSGIISVFAGRIADTGVDPIPVMQASLEIMKLNPSLELIWASPRELLNIFQADAMGCHIITVTNDVLKKLSNVGKDLNEFSLDTVKMFRNDAVKAGFIL